MSSSYMGVRLALCVGAGAFEHTRRQRIGGGVWLPSQVSRRKVTQASFFGVGAPEALLVGVVALVVFGPKGLAEAVKSLGNTLRTFQPTIRELASVSSDLRNTLEEQIGLDEIRQEFRSATAPTPRTKPVFTDMAGEAQKGESTGEAGPSTPEPVASLQEARDNFARDLDPDIERKKAESAAAAWGSNGGGLAVKEKSTEQVAAHGQAQKPLGAMTVEELEAELARRKGGTSLPQSQ